ncbi:tyrosine kinase family protein [Staphylococcus simulans]|nr:tyrosine kinase family protein [Staphylococcus simulans]
MESYIEKNNQKLNFKKRKRIKSQILKGFDYVHKKDMLHRDISPKNILLKEYDDGTLVAKISDFGLVKIKTNKLTSLNTEFKGSFNDPSLMHKFKEYTLVHEIYSISYLIYYILTGKTNVVETENNALNNFINQGMNNEISMRFKNIQEMLKAFNKIQFND